MLLFIVIVTVLFCPLVCNHELPLPEKEKILIKTQYPTKEELDKNLWSSDVNLVKFLLYAEAGSKIVSQEIKFNDNTSLARSKFEKGAKLKVLVHGLRGNSSRSIVENIGEEYCLSHRLRREKLNVIYVDWGGLFGGTEPMSLPIYYLYIVDIVTLVGKHIAKFLIFLQKQEAVSNYNQVHLIGFSMGAHACGVAGYHLSLESKSLKLGRITGLDPFGGKFFGLQQLLSHEKLTEDDANFVDIIHTTVGHIANMEISGTVDFFPNGGGPTQPSCFNQSRLCSHYFAIKVFIATIQEPNKFLACKCEPWDFNRREICPFNCTHTIPAGEFCPDVATGSYYFETGQFSG